MEETNRYQIVYIDSLTLKDRLQLEVAFAEYGGKVALLRENDGFKIFYEKGSIFDQDNMASIKFGTKSCQDKITYTIYVYSRELNEGSLWGLIDKLTRIGNFISWLSQMVRPEILDLKDYCPSF